jgi:CheY-like chemotaxis protein
MRIFNLFEQVHGGIEHSQGGLGIGLTLVRTLVELHGGTVEAKSPGLGLGSEFIVRLPGVVERGREATAAAVKSVPRRLRSAPLRVLVVDDSEATATSMAKIIRLWNHNVETSSDGFAALAAIRTFKPDVVLADLGMPRMHGYQLAEEIRRLPEMADAVLIAVSGYGQPADQERSREAGFAMHLVKPVDPDELKRVLRAAMSPTAWSLLAPARTGPAQNFQAGSSPASWSRTELLFVGACGAVMAIILGLIAYAVWQ